MQLMLELRLCEREGQDCGKSFFSLKQGTCTEPKITSGQRSISVQTTERTAQMITRPVIMTDRVNTLRSIN